MSFLEKGEGFKKDRNGGTEEGKEVKLDGVTLGLYAG